MKYSAAILLLVLTGPTALACEGFNSPHIKALIAASDSLEIYMTDKGHEEIGAFPSEAQKEVGPARMIPIDPIYSNDYKTTGKVQILSPDGEDIGHGTGFKISGSCILTSAQFWQ